MERMSNEIIKDLQAIVQKIEKWDSSAKEQDWEFIDEARYRVEGCIQAIKEIDL